MQLRLIPYETARVPGFEQTLTALRSIPSLLYRAIEFGTVQNHTYFDTLSDGDRPRPHIREMIVRDMAKKYLERHNIAVQEDTMQFNNEPLVAIVFHYGPFLVRVLKGRNGVLPGCGNSRRRRRFYSQHPSLYLDQARRPHRSKLNLVLLWDFDPNFNLSQLWLVCPRTGGRTSADVTWYWHEKIPRPVALNVFPAPTAEEIQASDDELENMLRDESEADDLSEEA